MRRIVTEDQRYKDSDLNLQNNTAEISEESVLRMKSLLLDLLQNEQEIEQWFGSAHDTTKIPRTELFSRD